MDKKELAQKLNGQEYPFDVPKDLAAAAKANRLVIVYGASDDLIEFEGAIYDEVGAYEGTTVTIHSGGLLESFESALESEDKERLRSYFEHENKGKWLQACWCDEKGIAWTYKTDIPHETFKIMEDDEVYCRGIVFSLDDCK